MVDQTSIPVIEQIARKIEARLKTVDAGHGYLVTCAQVVRPSRRNQWAPANGVTLLELDSFEDGEPETHASGLKLTRTGVWTVRMFVEPSDDDDTPMDALYAVAIAELERAIAADFYLDADDTFAGPGGYDGLGHNTELRAPQLVQDQNGTTTGVRVTVAIGYAHADNDPYTAL